MLKYIPLLILTLLLLGCKNHFPFAYHTNIQQGNVLDEKKVAQLHRGMTAEQVEYLLGTPVSQDAFVSKRWDYVYYLKPNRGDIEIRRVTVLFDDDKKVKEIHTQHISEPPLS